jgi:ABC-type nitrate/sulfonate/bicarbonate transport system substrate-binding protein
MAAVVQPPRHHHLHRGDGRAAPELVVALLKGMIKVGRWCNEHKHAAAAILNKKTFYLDIEDTYGNIKDVDMVPNLSPQNSC